MIRNLTTGSKDALRIDRPLRDRSMGILVVGVSGAAKLGIPILRLMRVRI